MEILSIGEKIKRARIYQGITLKELCGDRISLSKMSCIENNKVKAEESILEYIADKLKIDYNYLVQDIREQLIKNMNNFEDRIDRGSSELNDGIKYNLNYAIEYNYLDIAFKLLNKLFNIYLDADDEAIQELIVQYTDLYKINNSNEESIVYYKDMANFYFKNKEFNESIYYFSKIKTKCILHDEIDRKEYVNACYKISLCYRELGSIEKAYIELENIIDEIEKINDRSKIADAYTLVTCLKILFKKEDYEKYIKKAIEFCDGNVRKIAKAKLKLANSYFKIDYSEKGIVEVKEVVESESNRELGEYPELLLECVNILYENHQYIIAEKYVEEALNLSIWSNRDSLIQKAYYLKGMIFQKQERYKEAETYMNIAIDSLIKSTSREERYVRYNEMGELYYNLGEYKEAVKYFSLAINARKIVG